MAGALGVVQTTDVPVEGRSAVPCYVDESLPIVGPSRAVQILPQGPFAGGTPIPVRLAPAGAPAIGPALPIYIVSGILDSLAYTNKVKAIASAHLIAYWPLAESGGTTATDESGNGRTGVYSNVTLGAAGIGDGRSAAAFNGTTSACNVYGASLAAVFPTAEGTLAGWFLCNNWADGVNRRMVVFQATSQNRILFNKGTGSSLANLTYIAGNVSRNVAITMSPAGFFHGALTWSVSADQVIGYLNGVAQGSPLTGLGTWAGALAATTCVIGAGDSTPSSVWDGRGAHAALWNTPLSVAQIASLATVNTW